MAVIAFPPNLRKDSSAVQITSVKATLLKVPYPVDFEAAWEPGVVRQDRDVTVVRIATDAGLVGWGASGSDQAGSINLLAAPFLIGADPLALERHAGITRYANGAWIVEMALCDIVGKAAGLPLSKLWGRYTDRIPAYASIVAQRTPDERAEDALELLSQGFKAIKLRAHAATVAEDIAMVAAVRDAVGDQMAIMVDANQAGAASGSAKHPLDPVVWDFDRALETARAYEELGVYWLEEPLPRYDYEAIAQLTDSVELKIAGGEGNRGLHEFHQMLDYGAYDIIQPDATTSEGLWQLRRIATACERSGKLFIPHHGANGIALAAHMQLCSTVPNCPWVEYIIDPPWRTVQSYQQLYGVMRDPLLIDADGCLAVPGGPGLGVDIDEEAIARLAVRQGNE